jgi:hypothetical protein
VLDRTTSEKDGNREFREGERMKLGQSQFESKSIPGFAQKNNCIATLFFKRLLL